MSILGVESIIYATDDVAECIRFHDAFGLPKAAEGDWGADYRLDEGSNVLVRKDGDPSLPPTWSKEPGVREAIWGVSDQASLDAIEADLATDRVVTRDEDGTLHTTDDQGIAIGFRLFDRKVPSCEDPTHNDPGNIQRLNRHRKWYERAMPKVINHVVFGVTDIDAAVAFYTDRLGFRVSDISRGLGVFLRCDGRNEHHNLFFIKSSFAGAEDSCWHHVCYAVENIDEIMAGANHMQKIGYESPEGIGRRRYRLSRRRLEAEAVGADVRQFLLGRQMARMGGQGHRMECRGHRRPGPEFQRAQPPSGRVKENAACRP